MIKNLGAILLLAALWGASFLFIRIASPIMGPILTIGTRVIIAAFVLWLYTLSIKHPIFFAKRWKQYIIIGGLNAAIPFVCIAVAELYLPASMSAVLNALTPICTAIVAWIWIGEKVTLKKAGAIGIGFTGVLVLVGWSPMVFTYNIMLCVILSIFSTISYGVAAVYTKRTFPDASPLSLAIGQQIGASILILPFLGVGIPNSINQITPVAVYSVIALAIFCTAIAYLLYFYLIRQIGPVQTLSVTFLVPFFGILWSNLFLNEPVTINIVVSLLLILVSMLLISEIRIKVRMNLVRRTNK